MDTWLNLHYVTRSLALSPESREVYLFGSTARDLRDFAANHHSILDENPDMEGFVTNSNDFDLVVTVSPLIYDLWNKEFNRILDCDVDCGIPRDSYDGCKWLRLNLALKLLGCGTFRDVSPLLGWLLTLDTIKELDVHLMPQDWRKRTAELQDHLPHRDPLFVSNIAQDAIHLTGADTQDFAIWQASLGKQLARLQHVRQSIGHAAVLTEMVSRGLTAVGEMPQG